ncbi:hypothetical protein ACFFX0_08685 [Citricoccus parietis]|uniref:Secreted protein n=1 Tax=Citricoccus parietis TaxID=592307 RepID=A0ABV5FX63_9MICC
MGWSPPSACSWAWPPACVPGAVPGIEACLTRGWPVPGTPVDWNICPPFSQQPLPQQPLPPPPPPSPTPPVRRSPSGCPRCPVPAAPARMWRPPPS